MKINTCTLCSSSNFKLVYKFENDLKIVKCNNCNHVYTLIENNIDINVYYTSGDYADFDARQTIFEKILDYENKRMLNKIERLSNKGIKGKILDFGCGKGKFLKIAKKMGRDTLGVETSLPRAEYAKRNYNLSVNTDFYTKGKINEGHYNVICLFHVLEHISEPRSLLNNLLKDNLADNGILVLEVPNFKSLQSKIAGVGWVHLDVPRHINHFTTPQLKNLISNLKDVKLEILKVEYFSSLLGIQGMLNSIFNLFGYRKNIISELKYRRKLTLLLSIFFALPVAFLLEIVASFFLKGGVIRIFCRKSNLDHQTLR